MALSDNLTSHWSFEEASGTRNDSHGSNNLTQAGTIGNTTGIVGNAANFDGGAGDALAVASNSGLQPGPDFTMAFWYFKGAASGSGIFVGKDDVTNRQWAVFNVGGGVEFIVFDSSSGNAQINVAYGANSAWHFIVATYTSADKKARLNRDDGAATAVGSALSTGISTTATAKFNFGNRDAFDFPLASPMDQAAYWQRVLTGAEITFLYNGGAGRTYAEVAGSPAVNDYRIIPPTLNFIQPAGQLAIVPATA